MGDKFFFVDAVRADRNDKKLMRRHVMKGKNTGKKFHRQSRLAAGGPKIVQAWRPLRPPGVKDQGSHDILVSSKGLSRFEDGVDRPFGDAFHAFGLRVNIPPPAMQVVNECTCLT